MFGRIIEHGNELKRLVRSGVNFKKKEKEKEDKWDISLKTFSLKARKVQEDGESSYIDSSKEKQIGLFLSSATIDI